MACKADPGRGVDGEADVARIGQGRSAGVQADPNLDRKTIRPGSSANLALDGERRLEAGHGPFEDREHFISAGLDLAAIALADRRAQEASNIGEEPVIPVAKASDATGRVLDVGEQKGPDARLQRAHLRGASLDLTVHPLVFDG